MKTINGGMWSFILAVFTSICTGSIASILVSNEYEIMVRLLAIMLMPIYWVSYLALLISYEELKQ